MTPEELINDERRSRRADFLARLRPHAIRRLLAEAERAALLETRRAAQQQ